MKTLKLVTHQSSYSKDDLLISQKDFPDTKIGDVVEVYLPEDKYSRLLLQVTTVTNPADRVKNAPGTVSIEQSVATSFQLRTYSDVIVNQVLKDEVSLDSVELFFKDQYLSRSDMWRLKTHIANTCVYLNKRIEFSNIRCQVFEMWSQGSRMGSGYINDDTKVVFRSASSMVYLFLQMSSEMWDYDINGDLYFEKAIKGFLTDLFNKWKTFNCSHDVTIVFFSRTFYEASDISEFPESMRECLQQDSKGRFYEDYYRVAVQNERYEDWSPTLIYLKKLFNLYEEEVIHYHEKLGLKVPRAYNSSASQGNFLEVLNMSLNVFERHNLDRSFDRTGQLSVVISPGVGVYEVDLDLTNITKQRIIDNGIGSDLVCLGEQPLHAVPLFKFNSRHSQMLNDQYNMPHWINLSFYSSRQRFSSNFIPRIKMPNVMPSRMYQPKRSSLNLPSFNIKNNRRENHNSNQPNRIDIKSCQNIDFIDYDEYDSKVFETAVTNKQINPPVPSKKQSIQSYIPESKVSFNEPNETKRRLSDAYSNWPDGTDLTPPSSPVHIDTVDSMSSLLYDKSQSYSLSTSVETRTFKDYHLKLRSKDDIVVHKINSKTHRTKALINPFDPAHVTIKLNSNRRRWTHVFPLGPTGIFMQQHHYQAIPQYTESNFSRPDESDPIDIKDKSGMNISKRISFDQVDSPVSSIDLHRDFSHLKDSNYSNKRTSKSRLNLEWENKITVLTDYDHQKKRDLLLNEKDLLWAWGATGELEWTPSITTGVDWKSLVMPACLPITTDFLPDKRTLQQDYVTYAYDLLPEDQAEFYQQRYAKYDDNAKKSSILSNDQFYQELICQRLQQGFQMILLPAKQKFSFANAFGDRTGNKLTYILSIGRIYHELGHKENKISIISYLPRHKYKANNIRYCYRIRTPDNETYGVSWVDFTSESLEAYKWNYLDNYICMKGDPEYPLLEPLKYWRFRLLVLPTQHSITKKIIEKYLEGEDEFQCDLYDVLKDEEKNELQYGFLKLIEVINRVRRPLPKQGSRVGEVSGKNQLNRRYSSSVINAQAVAAGGGGDQQVTSTTTGGLHNRHSQPDATLSSINESKLEHSGDHKPPSVALNQSTEESSTESSTDSIPKRPSVKSQHSEIIDYMKRSNTLFFLKAGNLPANTFISMDGIDWAVKNIELVGTEANAEILFQSFQMNELIRHASGDPNQTFKRGFYLYCIMSKENQQFFERRGSETFFDQEWMEVGVVPQHNYFKHYESFYENSSEFANHYKMEQEFTFKNYTYELENRSKDRVEWVNVKYHSLYDPEQAFEMVIEWMVATGNAIPEIVNTWGRTKGTNLHIVPIPWDPFALPFSSKSDPLRGPIYISLNIDCLASSSCKILEGERLFNFQEKILVKFGFIPFHDPSTDNQRQFVHVSGSIFVMIPSKNPASSPFKNLNKRGKFLKMNTEHELACSPHEEYITRHFSGTLQQKGQDAHIDAKIGFLWCWNYMITKRWKTNVTGDENSMRKIMEDFRAFCSNRNERLNEFWKSYQAKASIEEEPELYE